MASSEACVGGRMARWACLEQVGRSSRLVDLAMACALFFLAGAVGVGYVATWGDYQDFYQAECGPAVMVALGHGYENPARYDSRTLNRFLARRSDHIPLDEPFSTVRTQPLTLLQAASFYLYYTIGLVWRFFGISWKALLPLFGLLYASSVVAAFGIFRLGMGRLLSFVCASAVMLSPLHLYYLPDLRDYSKAPFILFAVFVLGYLVKHPVRTRTLLLLCAGLGAVLGVGCGFRADVLIGVPAALVVIVLFLPGGPLRRIKAKFAACGLLLASFSMLVYPMIHLRSSPGGNTFHVMILGLMRPFDLWLGLEETPIEFGPLYVDYYAFAMVKSYHDRVSDPSEACAPIRYESPTYNQAGRALYGEYVRTFPANWITRWQAAVVRILNDIPFTSTETNRELFRIEFLARLFNTRWHLLHWLSGLGSCAALMAILAVSARSVRCSLALLLCLLYFLGDTSLQFQLRHYFHCEVAFWWVFGFLAQHTLSSLWGLRRAIRARGVRQGVWAPVRQHGRAVLGRLAVAGAATALILLVPLWSARACQTSNVKALVAQVQAQPLASLPLLPEPEGRGTLFRVGAPTPPVQPAEASAGGTSAEDEEDSLRAISAKYLFGIQTRYLMAEVECPGHTSFVLKYTAGSKRRLDFTSLVVLKSGDASTGVYRYFFPVYEGIPPADLPATNSLVSDIGVRFVGLSFPEGEGQRLRGLYEIPDLSALRLLPSIAVAEGQAIRPLYQRLAYDSPSVYPRGLAAQRRNLLATGDFEVWTPGGVPEGSGAPRGCSSITREARTVWRGASAVCQTWTESDGANSIFNLFHVTARDLQPDTCYEFFTSARCYSGKDIRISAWQVTEEPGAPQKLERLELLLVSLGRNVGFEEYAGRFWTRPGSDFSVVLTTSCNGNEFPAKVVWDNWRLVPAGP